MRINLKLNNLEQKNLTILENAIGVLDNEDIKLMLNRKGNRAGSSVIIDQRHFTKTKKNTSIIIKTIKLSTILKNSGITKVAALKADIEGYEYPVLAKFFEEAPRAIWPKAVVVESFGHTIPLAGGSPLNLLFNYGYRLIDHVDYNYMFLKD